MKNLSILLLSLAFFSCQEKPSSYTYEKIPCTVTEVQFFTIGQRHTMQIDPEWIAKTDCGRTVVLRRSVKPGDIIWGLKVVNKKP